MARTKGAARFRAAYLAVLLIVTAVGIGCTGGELLQPLRPEGVGAPESACADAETIMLGSAPVRRLTNVEYDNTIRDLLGGSLEGLPSQPSDAIRAGTFENDARALAPSDLRISRYEQAAMMIGEHIAADSAANDRFVGCEPANAGEEQSCGERFVERFGEGAFRRPLTSDERSRFIEFFESQRLEIDFQGAVQLTAAAMLQSPFFLYRLEIPASAGAESSGEQIALTPYEVASRLSYLLWESMPDEALMEAAADNSLMQADIRRMHAERMLADERAHSVVRNFARQWLHLERVMDEPKAPERHPDWTEERAHSAMLESERLFEWVVFNDNAENRTVTSLFSSRQAFVNSEMAAHYGVDGPSSPDEWMPVELGPEHSGLLTRTAFLAGQAHEASGSPPLRGVFMLERVLCEPRAAPPAAADTSPVTQREDRLRTNRELFEERTSPAVCQNCHRRIDAYGFGFENYDEVGHYRETDVGLPVDASGRVTGTDNDGDYQGAVELQARLAAGTTLNACVTEQFFRYANGRLIEGADACHVERLQQQFNESGGDLRALLIDIASQPEFALRPGVAGDSE